MLYVVGSGPAGVSCAKALLNRGFEVTMLDAGIELESEKKAILNQFSPSDPWDPQLLVQLKGKPVTNSKQPLKLSYGSSYMYQKTAEYLPIQADQVRCSPSFAKGGLSTVWGSSLMPVMSTDIQDWPIKIEHLAPYYRKVLEYVPMATAYEDLTDILPFYQSPQDFFQLSRQADYLLKKFHRHQLNLVPAGFRMGSARLAVRFSDQTSSCRYCGLCLYGCPGQLIYSSAQTLQNELLVHERFTYLNNMIVKKFEEHGGHVILYAENHHTQQSCQFRGEKIFLACGVISTAKIVLTSLQSHDQPLTIQDSQHFFVPGILFKRYRNLAKEKSHTLSQLYLEILNKKINDQSIHIQIYTYNDLFEKEFSDQLGIIYRVLKWPLKLLLERMILLKGFMHSSVSSSIKMELKSSHPEQIFLSQQSNPLIKKTLRKILRKLLFNCPRLGFITLLPLAKFTLPGAANHYGGSFPMTDQSKTMTTDILGRLNGSQNIHIIDASILPTMTSQSPTLTIMANAYRIGSEVKIRNE